MDDEGCDMMFAVPGLNQLYICKENYVWQNLDINGKYDPNKLFVKAGANDLVPCGILP
jgi:hypothetical protein